MDQIASELHGVNRLSKDDNKQAMDCFNEVVRRLDSLKNQCSIVLEDLNAALFPDRSNPRAQHLSDDEDLGLDEEDWGEPNECCQLATT